MACFSIFLLYKYRKPFHFLCQKKKGKLFSGSVIPWAVSSLLLQWHWSSLKPFDSCSWQVLREPLVTCNLCSLCPVQEPPTLTEGGRSPGHVGALQQPALSKWHMDIWWSRRNQPLCAAEKADDWKWGSTCVVTRGGHSDHWNRHDIPQAGEFFMKSHELASAPDSVSQASSNPPRLTVFQITAVAQQGRCSRARFISKETEVWSEVL